MTKAGLKLLVKQVAVSFKGLFPTKTQVATDIDAAKAEVKAYADTKTQDGATNDSVDTKIAVVTASITAFQGTIDDKIATKVAALGTFVGTSNKFATLPTVDKLGKDITQGDFAHLTAKDGSNKKGLYRYDGASYVFISGDPAVTEILASLKYTAIDDTNDDKFVTGKYLKDRDDANALTQAEVDAEVASA